MAPTGHRPRSLKDTPKPDERCHFEGLIRSTLSRQPTYECPYCELSYDSERLNCPACGFEVRKAT